MTLVERLPTAARDRRRRLATIVLVVVSMSACTPYAMSPAARILPLESVEPARPGHVALRAQGGPYVANGALATGTAAAHVGIVDDLEVQLSGTVAWIGALQTRGVVPVSGGGRLGVKHRVARWLAFRGGLGAGSGPWGAWGTGDLGFVFAYENPYFVPFIAADAQVSLPFDTRTEHIMSMTASGASITALLSPVPTFWFQPSAGFRVPLSRDEGSDRVRVSLLLAVSWTWAYSVDDHAWTAVGGEAGIVVEP
jgi:hypothetical protein